LRFLTRLPYCNILDRYILKEMMAPFFFGLAAFTVLFFSVETLGGVARMVVESKAGFGVILEYLANRLPQVIVFTCPMSVLLSGLLAFGRLSGESELTAMKAAGISFFRIAFPGLLFCALISGICFYINNEIVPRSMKRAIDIFIETQKKDPFQKAVLTAPRILKNGQEQMLYAHKLNLENREMKGIFIHYFFENQRKREVYAEEAKWNGKVWILKHLRITEFDKYQEPAQEVMAKDTWTPLQPDESPPSPEALARREFRPEEMSRAELIEKLSMLPPIEDGDEDGIRRRNRYLVAYHQKIALPWTSLIFGAFAIPLGVRPHRASTSVGIGLSIMCTMLYYVLMTVGMVLGETGAIDVQLGAWLPNAFFGTIGCLFLFDAGRK
jgi:lipopolysaccharide export system permease protein